MYSDYLLYKKRLEEILSGVRAEFLGQNEKLTEYVPDSANIPPQVLADQIAHLLLFRLQLVTDMTDGEIGDGRRWLKAAALFLLLNCPPEDHTPRGLLRLAGLSHETLALLKRENLPKQDARALLRVPFCVRDHLEEAVWALTDLTPEALEPLEGLLD